MSNRKQRLELTWIGKDERPRLEPRILLEDETKTYHAKARITDHDIFNNILIQGDNLLALKALEQEYSGQVKCVFIDPPYNTGSAFEHYDDGVEHSLWLSLMRDRLAIIRRLLSPNGSLWITIDDNEAHYLKVLLDEIFGRSAFIANIVWQKRTSRENRAAIGSAHDHILVYAPAGPQQWRDVRNRLDDEGGYSNPDNDPKGAWRSIPFSAQGFRPNQMYEITTPSGAVVIPPRGRCWAATEPVFKQYLTEARVYFPNAGSGRPRIKQYEGEESGLVPMTWWDASFASDNQAAKKEILELFGDEIFDTPKPEGLMRRIIEIASNRGELILDSFAGSGTTGAVAHKMGRRWIMVELGNHAVTHIVPRLKKVIDGADPGGITEAIEWKGGGGFRHYRLAPSLLEKDAWGNWVISKEYDPVKIARAVCKLMGFVYQPDESHYWMHGRSSESDFIYATTQSLTRAQLAAISEEVGDERTLLVCCKAFRADPGGFPNLTIKKIPQAVLRKCEWGKDDYSLNVANLPEARREPDEPNEPGPTAKTTKKRGNGKTDSQSDLFSQGRGK